LFQNSCQKSTHFNNCGKKHVTQYQLFFIFILFCIAQKRTSGRSLKCKILNENVKVAVGIWDLTYCDLPAGKWP